MFALGCGLAIYALVDFLILKRSKTKDILKSSLFCFLWGSMLILSWYIFVFVL
jgi:hypothetical protein